VTHNGGGSTWFMFTPWWHDQRPKKHHPLIACLTQ
jgi:hypothetical protein